MGALCDARKLTHGFLQLQSHYLFQEHFCQVRRPNEKGVVEGVVKFARLNYFVPVPQVKDFDELNAFLAERCMADLERTLRGRKVPKKELLKEDQAAFRKLPATPFDACRKVSTTADGGSGNSVHEKLDLQIQQTVYCESGGATVYRLQIEPAANDSVTLAIRAYVGP